MNIATNAEKIKAEHYYPKKHAVQSIPYTHYSGQTLSVTDDIENHFVHFYSEIYNLSPEH